VLIQEELVNLPNVIKKVVKTEEFGGMLILKAMQIILKNTADVEPETSVNMDKLKDIDRKIMRRRKKDLNLVNLWVPWKDLAVLNKMSLEEMIEVVKESIIVEEGKGFTFNIDPQVIIKYSNQSQPKESAYPEQSESTNIRFNKFIYEMHIR